MVLLAPTTQARSPGTPLAVLEINMQRRGEKNGKEKGAATEFLARKEEETQGISYGLCLGNVQCGAFRNV